MARTRCSDARAARSFVSVVAATQAAYRRIVEEVRRKHGNRPVQLLMPRAYACLMGEKSEHVTAANHRLRLLRALMARVVEMKMIAADPTAGVRRLRYKTDGYPTWSEAEIKLYEAKRPSGSRGAWPSRCCSTRASGGATWCAWGGST
jgi:hypothetical protein